MTPVLRRLRAGFDRRSHVEARLLIVGLLLAIAAAGLWVVDAARLGVYTTPRLSWWVFGLAFFATERLAAIDTPRRGVQAITMGSAPFVVGLFFATPLDLLIAYAAGSSVAAATRRPLAVWQTAYGIVRFAVFFPIGVLVFRVIAPIPDGPQWQGWVAAVAAMGVMMLRRGVSESIVLRPLDANSWRDVAHHLGSALVAAATSTCLGLVAVWLIPHDPIALVPLLAIALTVLMTHRAWVRERYDHEAAEFLVGAVDALAGRELEPSILLLLNRARAIFHADIAQLTVFPSLPAEKAFRTTVRYGRPDEVMVPLALSELDDVLEAESAGVIVRDESPDDPSAQMLARRGVSEAMVALLRGESRMIGSLMVGGHLDAHAFDDRDLRLFRTLATRTTAILENSRMERSIARLTELQEQLTHQAYHDSLTDLANRTLFGQHIDLALRRCSEGSTSVAVIFLDVDDFKGVNDTLGHAAGDALLVEVAARIRSCLRKPDTAARLGGDEFALLIQDVESAVIAEHVARRVLETLRLPFVVAGNSITVRASLGIAVADKVDDNAASLMRHADVAMYAAKGAGRDRYVLFTPGMESDVVHRRQLRGELETAMGEHQFVLHYQPVVNLVTGEVPAMEALVRWRHPTRGLVAPGEFISVAEESRLILPLGEFVLRTACTTALALQRRCPQQPPLSVCVNVSAVQLSSPTFVDDVLAIVRGAGLAPGTLILELTESMLLEDTTMVSAKLEALRRTGIRIAIDDFGTGYSSLSYLRRLPVDILKIAKPFVDDLAAGADEDFTRAIVSLAGALQLQVVAEGIEAASQVTRLLRLGCQAGQGYHLSHPLPDSEIELLLRHGGVDPARLVSELDPEANVLPFEVGAVTGLSTALTALLVVIITLVIGAAAWAAVRREKARLGFLHDTSQSLLEARDLETASVDLLRRACRRFNADCAELTLLPDAGAPVAFRTSLRDGDPLEVMRPVDLADEGEGSLSPPIFGVVRISAAAADPWVTRLAGRLGVPGGLAVTLRHEARTVGYLALGMRRAERQESRADEQTLTAFASLAALTIERSRLHEALLRLAAHENELADRAFHDPLTHLANRVLFIDRVERALLERDPERHLVSLVHVDLEGFRKINAVHGHATGDAVLIEVARRLRECLRRTDTAARLGGDEFALLLPEVLHPREGELIAQRVVEALSLPIELGGVRLPVSASVGLACAGAEEANAAHLLRDATAAAREARQAGSKTYRLHGGASAGSGDPAVPEELEAAIDAGELVLHFQPIVELKTGRILGAEALVRWQHPARGLIAPLHFLPLAAECGLMERIEEFVLRTACRQLRRWQNAYPATPELAMSVNVSGAFGRQRLVDLVTACLAEVQVDPSCLIVEVTENAVLEDLHGAITAFDALQRAGVHVAIDDVGTGYTSLAYLRRLPIDILKIARPLVAELGDPNSSGELARTVVRHGEALRLALVAEGVETPLQVERLNALGCGMAQGFHLARPCDTEGMESLLRTGGLDPALFMRAGPAPRATARKKTVRSRRVPSSGAAARNPA